jgi:hypothetical protein
MKKSIVIATAPGREAWVKDCLESIKAPAIVVSGPGYELGKIKWIFDNTGLDRFIFLQDSVIIKNTELLMSIFDTEGSSCIMCAPRCFGSYMGLYEKQTLDKIDIPSITTKRDAVKYEIDWTQEYIKACGQIFHPVHLKHQVTETLYRYGRENQVLVNILYEKWKGTWDTSMIKEDE